MADESGCHADSVLIAACLLVSGVALAGKSPATCAELIEADVAYVPQVIYWLDGYNWAGDAMLDEDMEWVPVESDDIIIDCKKDPSQKAAAVVKKHSKSKKVRKIQTARKPKLRIVESLFRSGSRTRWTI